MSAELTKAELDSIGATITGTPREDVAGVVVVVVRRDGKPVISHDCLDTASLMIALATAQGRAALVLAGIEEE